MLGYWCLVACEILINLILWSRKIRISQICFPFNYKSNNNNNIYIVSVSSPIHSLQSNGLKLSFSLSLVSCYTSWYETHACLSKQHTKETKQSICSEHKQWEGGRREGMEECVHLWNWILGVSISILKRWDHFSPLSRWPLCQTAMRLFCAQHQTILWPVSLIQ